MTTDGFPPDMGARALSRHDEGVKALASLGRVPDGTPPPPARGPSRSAGALPVPIRPPDPIRMAA